MMVQVPDSFDPPHGCIVTAPSSGSRGVYGAIATAGEWGLKRGCAVAYTDKGTGTGAHDLQNNTVNLIRGERADAAVAGDDSNFTARLSSTASAQPSTPRHPTASPSSTRIRSRTRKRTGARTCCARSSSHSSAQQEIRPPRDEITKRNTIVIASSVSNGGGASVRAVEQDEDRLIDGLAVGEPNVNPKFEPQLLDRAGRAGRR